jgi:RNA polymerase sigma factor (sigma-70 family)
MDLNEYIILRYSFLKTMSRNIVSRRSKNPQEDASDLLSYTVENILVNKDKYQNKEVSELDLIFGAFLKNQWNWINSTSKKSFLNINKINNNIDDLEKYENTLVNIEDQDAVLKIEINAEGLSENNIKIILDLLEFNYSNEQMDKILFCKDYYKKLNVSDQSLFELYFIKKLSIREISALTNVPRSSIKRILDTLKNKIKTAYLNS